MRALMRAAGPVAVSVILTALVIPGVLGPMSGVARAEGEAPKYACQRALEAAGKPPWEAQAECEQMMLSLRNVADDRGMTLAEREQLQACVANGLHGGASRTGLTNDCLKNQGASTLGAHETPSGGQPGPSSASPPAQPPGGGGGETLTAQQVQAAGCAQRLIDRGLPPDRAAEVCIAAVNQVEADAVLERECALFRGTHPVRVYPSGGLYMEYAAWRNLSNQEKTLALACGIDLRNHEDEDGPAPEGSTPDAEPWAEKCRALKREADGIWMQVRRRNGHITAAQERRLAEIGTEYKALKCPEVP